MNGDDLFDLPKDASNAPLAPETPAVDAPGSALPRRSQPTAPAGPPISSVESNAAAILLQVRRRQGEEDSANVQPEVASTAPSGTTRALWIALGALVLVNLATVAVLLSDAGAPSNTASTDEAAAGAQAPPAPATPAREKPRTPLVSSLGPSALESALEVLDEARADLAAGRRSSARARLGRLALAIDAIEPMRREEIRGEISLVVAQSLQEDVEAARRFTR